MTVSRNVRPQVRRRSDGATGFLGQYVAAAHERARALRPRTRELDAAAQRLHRPPSLLRALSRQRVGIIAEVKRASPSRGSINSRLDAHTAAAEYERGGAAAISVLTEGEHFSGSNADLEAVTRAVRLPVLRKDFHVDALQLLEARALGASAVLLIAAAVSARVLHELLTESRALELEALVEVFSGDELHTALDAGATMIGVNNRDLRTLEMHTGHAEQLLTSIPASCRAIAESGYLTGEHVAGAAAAGADGVLIGSALSASTNPRAELAGMTRFMRRRRSSGPAIKFCGVTRPEDAAVAREVGAEYVGVVFAESARRVTVERATEIFAAAGPETHRVGVFGSQSQCEIASVAESLALDAVQLHGTPAQTDLRELRRRFHGSIWQVVGMPPRETSAGGEPQAHIPAKSTRSRAQTGKERATSLEHVVAIPEDADGVVLDTRGPNGSGGTGRQFDWNAAAEALRTRNARPFTILAGGLNAANVSAAIETLRPDVVDVSSGVESAAGIKDESLMRAFTRNVRRC